MSIARVEEIMRKLAPLIGEEKAGRYLKLYILEDLLGRREMEQRFELMYRKLPDSCLNLVPPLNEQAKGDFPIGKVVYAGKELYPFSLRRDDLPRHILITGDTGSGKTNLIYLLLASFLLKDVRFWIFDRKGCFRDILSSKIAEDVLVFTLGSDVSRFYFNPNQPIEGIDPETILKLDIDNLEAFYVGEGVKSLLLKAKHTNYERFGIYSGKAEELPTPADDLEELKKLDLKRRKLDWFQSAERTEEALCFGKFGEMLNVRKCPDITKLARRSIIFEMLHLSNVQVKYIIDAILTRLYLWKRVATQRGDKSILVIIVDEAHHWFLKKKDAGGEEHITDVLLREGRSLGLPIILADQFCSLLSKKAFGCATKVAFSSGSRSDMSLIADEWLLTEEEREWLPKLQTGTCVMKLKDRYPTPFLVKVLLMEKGRPVTDKFIHEKMKEYSVYQKEVVKVPQIPQQIDPEKGKSERIPQVPLPRKREISDNEKAMLIDIRQYPFSGIKKRIERIKAGKKLGYKIIDSLKKKGLIKEHNITNKRSKIVLLEPSSGAIELLDSWGIQGPLSSASRHGDIVHQYFVEKVSQYREFLGHVKITKECSIGGGRTVDLSSLDKQGRLVLDEVDRDISSAARNIRKCLEVHRGLYSGKVELCIWMIERTSYLKLVEKVKSKRLDEKISLKVLFVRDYF